MKKYLLILIVVFILASLNVLSANDQEITPCTETNSLNLNETKIFKSTGENTPTYEITLYTLNDSKAQFIINGQNTKRLYVSESDTVASGATITLKSIKDLTAYFSISGCGGIVCRSTNSLNLGATRLFSYSNWGIDYEVTFYTLAQNQAQFIVNGQITKRLSPLQSDTLTNGVTLTLYVINEDLANFCINGVAGKEKSVCGDNICDKDEVDSCPQDCKTACIDSDSGQDYYVKGKMSHGGIILQDSCADEYNLNEFYCNTEGGSSSEMFRCQYGCLDGACVPFLEKPGEIEVPEEKIISSTECAPKSCSVISEKCVGTDKITIEECKIYVRDYIKKTGFCEEVAYTNSKILKSTCNEEKTNGVMDCQGCLVDKNTCVPFGIRLKNKDVEYYCDVNKEMFKQKENKESCQNSYECVSNNCKSGFCKPICEGCLNENNVCIPIGTRTETQYCDIEYSFKDKKLEDNSCNNNYECSSNLCVNNKCISPSLLQKIIDWFKKLFG